MTGRAILAWAVAAVLTAPAMAAEFDGATTPDRLNLDGRSYDLASCAMRELLWSNLYLLSFYLPRTGGALDTIAAPEQAKAIRLEVVWDGSVPDRLPRSWREAFEPTVRQDVVAALQNIYADIGPGDVVTVEYRPGAGTLVRINGREVLHDPGHDLMAAMLDMWVGRSPISRNMRRLLLSPGC